MFNRISNYTFPYRPKEVLFSRRFLGKIKEITYPYRWLNYMLRNGIWKKEEMWNSKFSFSYSGEDMVLESIFGRNKNEGYYVDVGAFHPIFLSNTYLFYRKGWRGINIEPNPSHYKPFPEMRERDINLNLLVSSEESVVKFSCARELSGIRDEDYLFNDLTKDKKVIELKTHRLETILDANLPEDQSIDFMSIDCEGHDYQVLISNNWSKYRPRVLLIEQHEKQIKGRIYDFLVGKGYRYYCKMNETMFFIIKEEAEGLIENP